MVSDTGMRKAFAPVGATGHHRIVLSRRHASGNEGKGERRRAMSACRSHSDPRFVRLSEELNSLNAAIDLNCHRAQEGCRQAARQLPCPESRSPKR